MEPTVYCVFMPYRPASLTSGMLYLGSKEALRTYLGVLNEHTLRRNSFFFKDTLSPHVKYPLSLICYGNVLAIHFYIRVSASNY